MIIVRIVGGLGNQMFQYAYAKSLQNKGYRVKINISKFKIYNLHGGYQLDKFNIDLEPSHYISNFLSLIGIKKNVKEKSLLFNEDFLNPSKSCYLKGYFQTEKYFADIKPILQKQFSLKNPISKSTLNYKNQIESITNSCSIHIRRGDFVSNEKALKIHGICSLEYYENAINFLKSQYANIHFFVFSDDLAWVKQNLKLDHCTYVKHTVIPHEDMYLMSLCKHNITANSSFSWWAAWLNKHKDKVVIAPKKWFVEKENEVACNHWIKL